MPSSKTPPTKIFVRRFAVAGALVAATATLSACAYPGPYNYAPMEAGQAAPLEPGVLVAFRPVQFGGQTTGQGIATGAVVGGLSGAAIGGDAAGTLVGGLVGAVLGNAIQRDATRRSGFAYDIRLRSGRMIEVAQPDAYPIPVNSPVYVSFGPVTRVIPASAYGGPPPPPPPPRY